MRKLQLTLIICLFLSTFTLAGQKEMRIADKQFDLHVYELAIESYKSALKSSPLNYHAMSRIAESHLRMNNIKEATNWYEKLITMKEVSSRDVLNYAHTLKKSGKYDDARDYYEALQGMDPHLGSHFAKSCDFSRDILLQDEYYHITAFQGNSEKSEFGPAFFNGQLVFSSFNDQIKRRVYHKDISTIQMSGNQLFVEDNTGNNFRFLRPEIKEVYNLGPVAYDNGGKTLAYTKNNFVDGRISLTGDEINLSIYIADVLNNGDFVNDRSFPFNSSMYANAFPYLTDEGQTMYFASNMKGGFGGFDLYISHLTEGEWTIPKNMGSQINSPGNEICPYISGDNLYFASDYHFGLGGYDIFYCTNRFGDWSFPENIGQGINSSSDDYFFAMNPLDGKMYFSSNRPGGKGMDDLYVASPVYRVEIARVISSGHNENFLANRSSGISNNEFNYPEFKQAPEFNNEAIATTHRVSEEEMPPAVSLKDLKKKSKIMPTRTYGKTVSFGKVINASEDNFFSLNYARKVAHGKIINTSERVYFIQLASLSRTSGNFKRFKSFVKYGNLYKVYKTNTVKIRLGYYHTREEAMEVLLKIRKSGVKDAFLVYEPLITSQLELIASPYSNDVYQEDNTFTSSNKTSNYKIRLASYTDPLWFDTEAVGGLGEIEQWTKGDWTIFVLSGYANIEEARQAQIKAINRGFTEAHVVIDNNGILEKLKEN